MFLKNKMTALQHIFFGSLHMMQASMVDSRTASKYTVIKI